MIFSGNGQASYTRFKIAFKSTANSSLSRSIFFMFTKAQASRRLVSLSCRYLARLRPTPVSSLHYRLQWSETHKTLVNIFLSPNISAVQFVWSQYFCHKTFMWVKISSSRRRCGRERRFSADKKGTTHKFFHSLALAQAHFSRYISLWLLTEVYWMAYKYDRRRNIY